MILNNFRDMLKYLEKVKCLINRNKLVFKMFFIPMNSKIKHWQAAIVRINMLEICL